MLSRKTYESLAAINARGWADANLMDAEEQVGAQSALMRVVSRQIAMFAADNPNFDARRFAKASGLTEDYLQARVLEWAAKDF